MPNEYINYEEVRKSSQEILNCAMRMQQIFDDVSGNMQNMTSSNTWSGTASNALQEEFAPFKNEFPKYVDAVRRFANLFTVATNILEENETNLNSQINEL